VFAVPVTNSKMKLFQVLLLAVTIIAWLIAFRPKARVLAVLVIAAVAGLFILPARDAASRQTLPAAHARAMLRYNGSTYWWGGENALGIDCSGLIRRGAIDALMREGLRNLDGGLLRAAPDLWWHDTSADALGEGYRGYTVPITKAKSLNDLDHSLVKPGDLAVTGGGSHILAYLGDQQWIQADPSANKVIVETAPSKNGWFQRQVKIVRWRWLHRE
jgi:cell wall-associated NlpC family hydrolase